MSGKDAQQNTTRPAVFLDRDGTIIEDMGALRDPGDIHLFPFTVSALKQLSEGYDLFIITNQSAVSAGDLTMEDVDRIHRILSDMLKEQGIEIKEWYVCPHAREDNCSCIKPNSHFLKKAETDYGIDLERSFVIGDHPHDADTGAGTGVFGLYLLTGHGSRHLSELSLEHPVFHSLKEAAEWIMVHPGHRKDIDIEIYKGAEAIKRGGLTAFPTETVYGLGADALNPLAAEKIFSAKRRPHNDPLIVHVSSAADVSALCDHVPEAAELLMEQFWPGPLTLVLRKSRNVPDIVTAGTPTVAVRMPAHPVALKLIRESGTPVAAPSANLFGKTSPTTAEHVRSQLSGEYDILIDGGACRVGVESTVLSLTGPQPVILRPGGISREEIEELIGPVAVTSGSTAAKSGPVSPGMLPSHYAPSTPFILTDAVEKFAGETDAAFMLFKPMDIDFSGPVRVLSSSGDVEEAAAHLYRVMRELDALGVKKIIAQKMPDTGIGAAVNDRMSRAAVPADSRD